MLFKRSSSSALSEAPWEPTGNMPLMSLRAVEKSFPVGARQTYVLRRITIRSVQTLIVIRAQRGSLGAHRQHAADVAARRGEIFPRWRRPDLRAAADHH